MGDSLFDKASGKAKQAVGDIVNDESLHREGRKEEQKGEEKDKLKEADEEAQDRAERVADLERETT
jgi:uncharacterized protein YjbJ (UPF0337 family)